MLLAGPLLLIKISCPYTCNPRSSRAHSWLTGTGPDKVGGKFECENDFTWRLSATYVQYVRLTTSNYNKRSAAVPFPPFLIFVKYTRIRVPGEGEQLEDGDDDCPRVK